MQADLYSRRPSLRAMRWVYCSVMMSAYESTISCAVGCTKAPKIRNRIETEPMYEYSSKEGVCRLSRRASYVSTAQEGPSVTALCLSFPSR